MEEDTVELQHAVPRFRPRLPTKESASITFEQTNVVFPRFCAKPEEGQRDESPRRWRFVPVKEDFECDSSSSSEEEDIEVEEEEDDDPRQQLKGPPVTPRTPRDGDYCYVEMTYMSPRDPSQKRVVMRPVDKPEYSKLVALQRCELMLDMSLFGVRTRKEMIRLLNYRFNGDTGMFELQQVDKIHRDPATGAVQKEQLKSAAIQEPLEARSCIT